MADERKAYEGVREMRVASTAPTPAARPAAPSCASSSSAPIGQRDARVSRSCAALSEAMLQLITEGRGPELTVSALCERAGVSRPTFYQHFGSVEGLLAASLRLRLDDLGPPSGGSLAPVLQGLAADRAAYGARLDDAGLVPRVSATLGEWLADRLRTVHPDADPLAVEFAAGGAARAVLQWLDEPGEESAASLSARLLALVERVVRPDHG